MFNKILFRQVDNGGLVVFRAIFGLLITLEAWGAIATGWVRKVLIEPEFTFSFIGFEWLQPLPGNGMYVYFFMMGCFGVLVMLGYKYRWSIIAYTILWAGVYFMQKESYNNHYYLMLLLLFLLSWMPANRRFSIDSRVNPKIKSNAMPGWCRWVLILQVFIVYTYASIAKLYPDWLDATAPRIFMQGKADYWLIGSFLQQNWVHWVMAYTGIFFDLLIVPLLLWKRTRLLGFGISVFFHLFNSVVFQIGIFPYMSIAFALLFFSPETIHKRFLPKEKLYKANTIKIPKYRNFLLVFFSVYFLIQLGLPVRHWFMDDDVLWTEEGHRLSWRMMLRSKTGSVRVKAVDKNTGEEIPVDIYTKLTAKQRRSLATKPDFMWQFAQRLKKEYAAQGHDLAVYYNAWVSVNRKPALEFIDSTVDLAAEKWYPFKHHHWILPMPEELKKSADKSN